MINKDGLRDRDHSRSKPSGVFRIAILGDSYAEALQLPIENTFWAEIERQLGGCPAFEGEKVEVINFGVSGYGTAQELLTLHHLAWEFQPDLVLLAFLTGNDVRNNAKELEPDPMRPFFVLDDGNLRLDSSFRSLPAYKIRQGQLGRIMYAVFDNSRLAQLLNKARQIASQTGAETRHDAVAGQGIRNGGEIGLDSPVYREPDSPAWRAAWDITERLLVAMRDEVRQREAELLVVTLSNGIQVHPEPAVRASFMDKHGIDDLFYPDRRVMAFGERNGIAVLNLAPDMQAYAEAKRVYLHGFGARPGEGHWNVEGHRLAGEKMARSICASRTARRTFPRRPSSRIAQPVPRLKPD